MLIALITGIFYQVGFLAFSDLYLLLAIIDVIGKYADTGLIRYGLDICALSQMDGIELASGRADAAADVLDDFVYFIKLGDAEGAVELFNSNTNDFLSLI